MANLDRNATGPNGLSNWYDNNKGSLELTITAYITPENYEWQGDAYGTDGYDGASAIVNEVNKKSVVWVDNWSISDTPTPGPGG